jgi:4-alpha-glucanotransferase
VKPTDCAGGSFSATAVDFGAVKLFKYTLLETAWKSFGTGARLDLRLGFERFGQEQAHWLNDHALFSALKARYGGAALSGVAGGSRPPHAGSARTGAA